MVMRKLHRLPHHERVNKMAEFREAQEKRAGEVLSLEQQNRLRQLGLQYEGAFALTRERVAEALQLTEEQRQRIDDLMLEFGTSCRDLHKRTRKTGDWPTYRRRKTVLRQKASEDVWRLLSSGQAQEWESLVGKTFFTVQRTEEYERYWWKSNKRGRRKPVSNH
jgi:hypothetical protein